MVELRRMILSVTPPATSIPRDSGVTSSSSISLVISEPPPRIFACTAAPSATTSSGFRPVCGTRLNRSCTRRRTLGMRVEPPTSTTSSICSGFRPASFERLFAGADGTVDDGLDHLPETFERNFAPIFSPAGQIDVELRRGLRGKRNLRFNYGFADAGHGFSVRRASVRRSSPKSPRMSSSATAISRLSMSSPPKCVSPLVATTSKMPSCSLRIEMSKVPRPGRKRR